MDDVGQNPPKGGKRFVFFGLLLVALVLAVFGYLRWKQGAYIHHELKARAKVEKAGPLVEVVRASRASEVQTVELLGEARPYLAVTLYGKISGYLKDMKVDRGDKVAAGQVLATIDTPELDRDFEGAVADAKNKRAIAKRNKELLPKGGTSIEVAETTEASAQMAEARVASLQAQLDYKLLRAPFRATVTARYADPGALVQAATSSQTTALPILTLGELDRLRISIYPDQKTAGAIRIGDKAEVWDVTRPHVKFPAAVSRTSGELDVKTRTLLVEVDLDNRQGAILPGSFVRVSLSLKAPPSVEVPAEALVSRGETQCVCVVGPDNRVTLHPVTIYESDGRTLKLTDGVAEGDRVVLHLGGTLVDGERVQPVERKGK